MKWGDVQRHFAAVAIMLIALAFLFAQTPTNGDFSWSESSRNGMSGAFVRDLILAMPFEDPVGWTEAYYAKYPALVILFYPPLLHVVLGLFFLMFGVSHLTAMVTIFTFYVALIFGVYFLGRRFFSPLAAAGVALAFTMSPEIALWGRQILLEIPMMALLTWAVWFGLRFTDNGQNRDLYAMAILGVCSLYMKQTGIFVILSMGLFFIVAHGWALLARRNFWLVVGLSLIGLLPLVAIQLKFATFNAINLGNHPDGIPGSTLSGLSWYLVHLPEALTWWVLVPAATFLLLALPRIWRGGIRLDALFLAFWFLVGYAFFTAITLKETRHGIPMYLPIVFASAGAFSLLPLNKWREYIVLALGLAVTATTLLTHPSPYDGGYNKAADYIAKHAPRNAIVLFSGHKDGDFIFNIRSHAERQDIAVLRADKLFLNITVLPQLGLNPKSISAAEIAEQLTRFGISYVVSDEKSFAEADVIKKLIALLHSDAFERVETISVTGSPLVKVDSLVIYRNKAELPIIPEKPDLNIGAIDRKIKAQ